MLSTQLPTLIQEIWAKNAGGGYVRVPPWASQIGIQAGAASFDTGFPPLCFIPKESGGAFPFGQDFNGIFQLLSAGVQWLQMGGLALYSATLSAALGGYPLGAVLVKANGTGFWINAAENNTSNPDTGGAGWNDLLSLYVKNDGRTYGINISGNATTATNAQAAVSAQSANTANTATNATNAVTAQNAVNSFGPGGQTWQNPGRALNVVYTNNTGRPIQILAFFYLTGSGTETLRINGNIVGTMGMNYSGGSFHAIIPNGNNYEITGPGLLTGWWELR